MGSYSSGWYLISIPFAKVNSLSSNCEYYSFYGWDDSEKIWNKIKLQDLKPGYGYWMKVEGKPCEIIFSGTGDAAVNDIPPLKRGWNAIGSPRTGGDMAFSNLMSGCQFEVKPYTYDPERGWYEERDSLKEMKGYWMKVTSDCSMH